MTKLLTLVLLLLSCGVVEAAEPNPKLWYGDPQLGVTFTSPCEIKMKEAMKLAEKYKGDLFKPFHITAYSYSGYYPSTERCITSACLQKELDEAKAKEKQGEEREKAREKWRTVYKECVQ